MTMMRRGFRLLAICAFLVSCHSAFSEDLEGWPRELDPESVSGGEMRGDVPDWIFGNPKYPPFSLKDHFALGTSARWCASTLSRAALAQDIGNALSSAAHFDNCAFQDGLAYIRDRQSRAASDLIAAQDMIAASGQVSAIAKRNVLNGLFKLGQALHAIQDFYSHSDYVEIMEKANVKFEQLQAFQFFNGASDQVILRLVSERGLVSGRWAIGRPKRCTASTSTHGELAKDHMDEGKGEKPTVWGKTYHFVAFTLAQQSTRKFLEEAYRSWPALERICGELIGMNAPSDVREEKEN